ncbi:50S ribosomal protein L9 [Pseudovibrio sp. Tun.PSC04-5.I4]|uniref:50S ribosomal protein L9 n=1 Tax=Pseudovibrio sp. Tun.PSC04-5.I4 TaxID=1798213 RepID=UPI00088E75B4|nr:50S ribosomal protein L9 [Pseudovibrio sp. Tun.PSC04-5.I4]SDQ94982.1 LSU ribosomal protein L9P [Pseudovibrio sp. Tun.PSC04-5.I4]
MKIILLERVAKLGQMGDTVTVRDGYARNFLLPQSKALRANKGNLERFENERSQLEARNLERKSEAAAVGEKLAGNTFTVIRAAGETGQLYGSVATRDISELLTAGGFSALRSQVTLRSPIKTIGMHEVVITLHPEVEVVVSINVARSIDEAQRQQAGEDLTGREADAFEFDEDEELEEGDEAASEEAAEGEEEETEEKTEE